MITPVFAKAGATTNFPSTSAASYASIVPGAAGAGFNTTAAARIVPFPVNGTFQNLQVNFPTTLTQGSYDVHLIINGVATSSTLHCQVTTTASVCTDSSGSAAITAGQSVAIEVAPTGTPTTQAAAPQISFTFTASSGQDSFVCASSTAAQSTTAINYTAVGTTTSWGTVENVVSSIIPVAGQLDRLYVITNSAPGAGSDFTVTVEQNGSDSALKTTVSGTNSASQDLSDVISVSALDTISFKSCPSAASALGTNCNTGSTPGARAIAACMRWQPTTPNQALALQVFATLPGTVAGTAYGNFAGNYANTSVESGNYNIAPPLGSKTLTIGGFVAAEASAPGSGNTRTLSANLASTYGGTSAACGSLQAQITNTSTITLGTGATSGAQDSSHTCSPTAGQFFDLKSVSAGSSLAVGAWLKSSAWMTLQ